MNPGSEKTSVQVVLRIRPITDEDTANLPTRFQRQVLTTSPYASNQVIVQGPSDKKSQTFNFDHVFGPETKQHEIFENSILNMIDQFLEGYNVTILAYGQTSSGKTHTMGTTDNFTIPPDSKGIIPRAMETLFSSINSSQCKSRNFSIKVSFVEIYNEDLIDLLGEQVDESKPQVMIREDSKGTILLSGLQEMKVNSVNEVITHLSHGSLNRQVGATDMNSQSSRSHAIFSVIMSQQKGPNTSSNNSGTPRMNGSRPPSRSQLRMSKRLDDVENVTITSKLHFVDLAGSERLKRTSAFGDRAKEGISINSGLLALGNVISALGDPNKAKHTTHIPYRDSKLTRLLQDSLGGNAQTLMIACVSPTEYNLSETINTLKYANRARNIKNSASINQEETGWNDLEHLQSLVLKLRSEIKALKSSNSSSDDDTFTGESGRSTPVNFQKGDSSKIFLNMITKNKNKDIELLEEQLLDLQRSYSELSTKYAITSAELALHQDIYSNGQSSNMLDVIKEEEDDTSSSVDFREAVEPIIEEYERSISSLESQLALSRAAASHTETIMKDQEGKLEYAEQMNEQNVNLINDLKNKIATLSRRETVSEQYIKELEFRLEKYTKEQNKDQEMINELKNHISQFKSNGTNTQSYITDLEARLAASDQQIVKFIQAVEKLEKRLQQREDAYLELESKMKSSYSEEDVRLLRDELGERDNRILQLEQKVDELVHELELLRKLKDNDGGNDDKKSNSTSVSLSKSSLIPTSEQDKLIITALEEKLEELQKMHEQTANEFDDIKLKYEGCLQEIHELQNQLTESRLNNSDLFDSSQLTPMSSLISSSDHVRRSLPSFNKEGNIDTLNFINAMIASKQMLHRKAISLSAEMINKEKKDHAHESIVQKLQKEIQQLESLHEDNSSGLEVFKQGFARLDTTHRETLEVVKELREEIKRRDLLAQLEVMSVMTSNDGDIPGITNEIDENEIIRRLREEVEKLREEQKQVLECISEREQEIRDKGIQVVSLVSNIRKLREQLYLLLDEDQKKLNNNDEENKKLISELQSKVTDLEQQLEKAQEQQAKSSEGCDNNQESQLKSEEVDEEIVAFKLKVEKLQAEIESKSHTIAVLLLPAVELQDTIHKLENELQEAKQAYRKALEENIKTTDSDIEENVKELEDKVKNLESQLIKAKEVQLLRIPRITLKPTRETVEIIQENLFNKSDKIDHLQSEQGSVKEKEIQSELDKLKFDINEKHELIEILKRDLADKDDLQQKLREKEAEASSLRLQLSEVKNRDEETQKQIKQLRIEVERKGANEVLQSELEGVKKELRNSKEKESFALERLKMLDVEETKLRQEMKRLRHVELLQKERITVLESRFSRQSFGRLNDDVFKLKNELETAKETEMLQRKTIADLESKLEKSVKDFTSLRTKIDYIKSKISINRSNIIERENRLSYENSSNTKKLKGEIESLRVQETINLKKIENLEAQLVLIQKNNDVTSLKDELSELRKIKSNLEKTVQDLESKLSIAQKESEKMKMINDEIKLLKELKSEQKSTIEQLQFQLQETTFTKDSVIKELEGIKIDFGTQKELIIMLEDELKDVREELTIVTENNVSSLKKLEDLSKTLKITLLQRDEKEMIIKELEFEVEQFKDSTAAGQKDINTLRNQLKNSRFEIETQNELLAKLGMQIMNVEKERDKYVLRIKELAQTLEVKEAEQREAVSNFESIIANLQIQLVETESSSQIGANTIKRLKDKLSTVETQFNRAKTSDKKRAQIVNELESKLKETNYTLSEKEELLSTKNILIKELEEVVKKIRFELGNAKKAKAIETERVKKLEVEIYELKVKYEDTNLDELSDSLNKVKNELEKVRNSETEQAELVKTLEIQLQEAEVNKEQEMFKLQEAIAEIKALKSQCDQLKRQINGTDKDNIDSSVVEMVEDLTKQLEESRTELKTYRDRVEELENIAKQLESDKTNQIKTNANLLQQVEQLQKEAEEFTKHEDDDILSNEQNKHVTDLENETKKIKIKSSIVFNKDSSINDEDDESPIAKLTKVNNSLLKTNEDLASKIKQAKDRMNALCEKIKHLESELMSIRLFENNANNDETVNELKEKIRELEAEVSNLKQQSTSDTTEVEKGMAKLLEVNEKLGKEVQKNVIKTVTKHSSMPSEPTSPTVKERPRITSLDGSIQTKLLQQESTIMEQDNLIKILKEKIFELESRTDDELMYEESSISGMLDLDAVGGFHIPTKSSALNISESTKKKNKKLAIASLPITPPPTPPPQSLLSPTGIRGYGVISPPPGARGYGVISPPPRNANSPTPALDLTNAQPNELILEIQRLQKRIAKMESESVEIGNLENSLKENETNLRVAKQQLQILQREKTDLLDQIKKLKSQLDETTALFENTKSSVQEEKKVIENVLEEERRAKENAEKARRQLENRMEELMAKRSKFMCF